MQRLKTSDLTALAPFIRRIYASDNVASFVHGSVQGLRNLLPSSHASYNDIDLPTGTSQWFCDGPAHFAGIDSALALYAHEHPIIMHYAGSRDGSALKISDFLSETAFRRLGLYADLYRHLDVRYQIAVRLPSRPGSVIDVALSRNERDYTERERVILNALRPHLARASECAVAMERAGGYAGDVLRGLYSLNYHVLVVHHDGKVGWHSPGAERILDPYFGAARERFSDFVRRRVAEQERRLAAFDDVPPPVEPQMVRANSGALLVYVVPGDRAATVIVRERRECEDLRRVGLSQREAAILDMIARGLTNRQIGEQLAISWRTVGKHVEHICAKLRVKSRGAAVAAALRYRLV
jgi:DNA-binding CsgD family transcriptional regulator